MSLAPYDQPTAVEPVDGEVVLSGPGGIGLSMTPQAAIETGRRLQAAGLEALRQRAAAPRPPPAGQ